MRLKKLASAICALGVSTSSVAELEEIVVTATKREASVQEVPIAITALSATQLERAGIKDLRDLSTLSSSFNMNSSNTESQGSSLRIRGVGTTGNNIGLESAVGVFIDGVYISRPGIALTDLVDIERIEVLRGPQGTLFGRNTSAGALNIISQKPDLVESSFWANATVGNYDARSFQFGGNLPIVEDQLGFRFSGAKRDQDGFSKSVTTGAESLTRDRYSLRGQLLWLPNDDMEVRIIGDYAEAEEECCDAAIIRETSLVEAGVFELAGLDKTAGVGASGQDAFQDLDTNAEQFENPFEQHGLSVQLDWDLGFADLVAIASYRDFEAQAVQSPDLVNLDVVSVPGSNGFEFFDEIDTYSLEVRLQGSNDNLDWMVGAYYSNEDIEEVGALELGSDYSRYISATFWFGGLIPLANGLTPAPALTAQQLAIPLVGGQTFGEVLASADPALAFANNVSAQGSFAANRFEQQSQSFSIYTHNTLHITESLDLVFGLRWIEEEKDGSFNQLAASNNYCLGSAANAGALLEADPSLVLFAGTALATNCFVFSAPADLVPGLPESFDDTFTDEELTYTAKVVYLIDDASSAYASFTHGFKAGGFNLDATAASAGADPRFDSETIDAWEIGYKAQLWENRVRANIAIFYQEIEDFQVLDFDGIQFATFNVDKTLSTGAELEVLVSAVDNLDVKLSLTYADARYPASCDGGDNTLAKVSALCGNDLTNAPIFVSVLGANYGNVVPGTELNYFVNGSIRYETKRRTGTQAIDLASGTPLQRDLQNSNSKVNLRVGLSSSDEKWSLELFGNNITNKQTRNVTFDIPLRGTGTDAARGAFFEAPRTYGVTLRTQF